MFNTKGQEIKTGGASKSITAGVCFAHIYSANLKVSKTGKKSLELILETPSIEGFEGWAIDKNNPDGPKFKGQSAKVTATVYTDQYNSDNPAKNDIIYKLLVIASELNLREEVDAVNASNIEEWVENVVNILKGKNLYFFLKGSEEEYNGKTIIKLSFPKYKFASISETNLDKFDKNNQYHYKALSNKPISSFEPASDDFQM